jgi:hypothetical protein
MARAADFAGSSYLGGRAVAAAVALHHLRGDRKLMAGWDTDEGTSVTATDRLRAALPRRRRRNATPPEHAPETTTSLDEDRLRLVSDYIGDYPESETERRRCNRAFHELAAPPIERTAS